MGYKQLELNLPTNYSDFDLTEQIKKTLKIKNFEYSIDKKSLDARQKRKIHWTLKLTVSSDEIKSNFIPNQETLEIKKLNTDKKVVIVGSGPAGFFSGLVLIKAGFKVTIIEQGPDVFERVKAIRDFEKNRNLNEKANYSFGEGGAGTFSDGKLTCRTKTIPLERKFIFEEYIKAGAPEEIRYLAKPHIGSNILVKIARKLRKEFKELGGEILFETEMLDYFYENDKVSSIETNKGKIEGDIFIFATGHSNYQSYQLLIRNGVKFQIKPFALGSRVEHLQENINWSLWSCPSLEGVKNSDYALTYNDAAHPVYSFCMCPGGWVIPAPQTKGLNIVNGMSNYKRNSPYANSAIVAGINLNQHLKKEVEPMEAIEWLSKLEHSFYDYVNGYDAPAVKVKDFINDKITNHFPNSSYCFDLKSADFSELYPKSIYKSLQRGYSEFSRKIKGFEEGIIMGLESRTSSPIQALRNKNGLCDGFDNLYFVGEGSGFSGGIISSGADGIKAAIEIINRTL